MYLLSLGRETVSRKELDFGDWKWEMSKLLDTDTIQSPLSVTSPQETRTQMSQLPPEVTYKVAAELDVETLLAQLQDSKFRAHLFDYFEIVSNVDATSGFWNYEFKRTLVDDVEVSSKKIYLVDIVDFQSIHHEQFIEKFKDASVLLAISQGYSSDGHAPSFLPGPARLAKVITTMPHLTVVYNGNESLELAFQSYELLDLQKLRFLRLGRLDLSANKENLKGILNPAKLNCLTVQVLPGSSFDILTSVDPTTLKNLQVLSYINQDGLSLSGFKFDNLRRGVFHGVFELRDLEFPSLKLLQIQNFRGSEAPQAQLYNFLAPELEDLTCFHHTNTPFVNLDNLQAPKCKSLTVVDVTSYANAQLTVKDYDFFKQIRELSIPNAIGMLECNNLRTNIEKLTVEVETLEQIEQLELTSEIPKLEILYIGLNGEADRIPMVKAKNLKNLEVMIRSELNDVNNIPVLYPRIEELKITNNFDPFPECAILECVFHKLKKLSIGCQLFEESSNLTENEIGWIMPKLEKIFYIDPEVEEGELIIDLPNAPKLKEISIEFPHAAPEDYFPTKLIVKSCPKLEKLELEGITHLALGDSVGQKVKFLRFSSTPLERLDANELPVIEELQYLYLKDSADVIENVNKINPNCTRKVSAIDIERFELTRDSLQIEVNSNSDHGEDREVEVRMVDFDELESTESL